MKLDEYVKKHGYHTPILSSVYDKYSDVFKKYYNWVSENIRFRRNENKEPMYICFKNESEEYQLKFEENKYCYDNYNNPATREDINRIEESFSKGFKDGFKEVEFKPHLTKIIIDNIVFQDRVTDIYFKAGIIKRKSHSFKLDRDILMDEETSYSEGFDEGKRFKSYFLYIEYYEQFKDLPEPFIRPLKRFTNKTKYKSIHSIDPKYFDLDKALNIVEKDIRIETTQSKEEVYEYFTTRLSKWYSDGDIEFFLEANFKCFECKKTPKPLKLKEVGKRGIKIKIKTLMYEFYLTEKVSVKKETKMRFAEVLRYNFEIFEGSKLNTIYQSMGHKYHSKELCFKENIQMT